MGATSSGSGKQRAASMKSDNSLFDLVMSSKSRDAYFWQYNVQSKGPKTKRVLTLRNKDPHLHRDFFDPVYQLQALSARNGGVGGAASSGGGAGSLNKLRKGDGNDVTPNAEKLYNLGNQIRDFINKSYEMNSACLFTPQQQQAIGNLSNEQAGGIGIGIGIGLYHSNNNLAISAPAASTGLADMIAAAAARSPHVAAAAAATVQPLSLNLKREKNKIASRACRLKKKAQHEANKIKLSGLNEEHSKPHEYEYRDVSFSFHFRIQFDLLYVPSSKSN